METTEINYETIKKLRPVPNSQNYKNMLNEFGIHIAQ